MRSESISVSNQSSETTGNTELKAFNFTRTCALKIEIVMLSFVVLELLGSIGFHDRQNMYFYRSAFSLYTHTQTHACTHTKTLFTCY